MSLPQEPFLYFLTAAAVSAPAGASSLLPHCRSSAFSRRSFFYIPPLPQQYLLPQEPPLYFHTAAAVSSPAQAFSVFLHCRSSVRSRRSPLRISTLSQQYLLPQEPPLCFHTATVVSPSQEPFLYFLTAAAVSAPAGASPLLPQCCSSVRCSSNFLCISTLPQ
ncbi:hypothetical protein ROHU_026529 [Labeo rohita]|uniref:Uncharacterized protein n=1 Tax=Labeo rohita TaxID=84645 RepID=A0A498MKZ4_LABRO|nr:hypothetical protein ROHU_026529 [Labeo rohita]